jgi:hypothetical protein
MTTLSADRLTPARANVDFSFGVEAATKIFAGGIVCINAANNAVKGSVATTLKCVGVAQEQADNTAGAAGAIQVKVRRGLFRFANSSAGDLIALANVGANAYIVDDQTVALTNGGATRSVAGVIRDVDSAGVWVEF